MNHMIEVRFDIDDQWPTRPEDGENLVRDWD